MPFPTILGIPEDTDPQVLENLRAELIAVTSVLMNCSPDWIRPFFPRDLLPTPSKGCSTILVKLETGMFHGRADNDLQVMSTLKSICQVVWRTFKGRYEVEAAVDEWHPGWKYMIEAVPHPK